MPHLPELIPPAARGHAGVLRTLLLSGLHPRVVKCKTDGRHTFTSLMHKVLVHKWSLILYRYSVFIHNVLQQVAEAVVFISVVLVSKQ